MFAFFSQDVSNIVISHTSERLHSAQFGLDTDTYTKFRKGVLTCRLKINILRVFPEIFIRDEHTKIRLRLFELAFSAQYTIATLTLKMTDNIVIMIIGYFTCIAYEWFIVRRFFL